MKKIIPQITTFFSLSLVFFSFQGVSKRPVTGRVILTLKGEELNANLGNDVLLDAPALGLTDVKIKKKNPVKISLKELIHAYHPDHFSEVHIFSKEITKNTPYTEAELSPSSEPYLKLTQKELQKSEAILFWNNEKSMLALEFSQGQKKYRVESVYKIHFIKKHQDKTNVKIDSDF